MGGAWLLDPAEVQVSAATPAKARGAGPWNGEFYASLGHGPSRCWDEARRFGCVGATRYSNTLKL